MLYWRTSESTLIPEEIDETSSKTVVSLHKNVKPEYRDGVFMYRYDEAVVPVSRFAKDRDIILAELAEAKRQDILRLMVENALSEDVYAPPVHFAQVKEGYLARKVYDPESNRTMWLFEPIPDYVSPAGTYQNPHKYVEGMSVTTGEFYTDDDDIWEAIQTGTPLNFFDDRYFDIKGVI